MRRRRAVWLLAGIGLGFGVLLSGHDKAAYAPALRPVVKASTLTASGDALTVVLPCAGDITLVAQPGLKGQVLVSGGDDATAGLHLTGGPVIVLRSGCRTGSPDLVVRAPASMPLTLEQSGGADLHVGAFTGPVHLSAHGSGDVAITSAGGLIGAISGSGDLSVGRLDGDLRLGQAGSGDIRIGTIHAASVHVSTTGTGDVSIRSGHVGQLTATMRGSGDLSVDAQVDVAAVQAGEGSDVSLPHLTGRLERSAVSPPAPRP